MVFHPWSCISALLSRSPSRIRNNFNPIRAWVCICPRRVTYSLRAFGWAALVVVPDRVVESILCCCVVYSSRPLLPIPCSLHTKRVPPTISFSPISISIPLLSLRPAFLLRNGICVTVTPPLRPFGSRRKVGGVAGGYPRACSDLTARFRFLIPAKTGSRAKC